MSAQIPKETKRQHLPQPQSVHPAAVWQKIQKYPLPNHQTPEQLHPASIYSLPPMWNTQLISLLFIKWIQNLKSNMLFQVLIDLKFPWLNQRATGQESFWQSCVRFPSDGVQSLWFKHWIPQKIWPCSSGPLWVVTHTVQWGQRGDWTCAKPKLHLTYRTCSSQPLNTTHLLRDTHPLPTWPSWCWGPDEEWGRHMPAEPSMPPTGSANNEVLKGSTGRGGAEGFFFLLPKALLRDFFLGVHTPELWTAFSSLMSALPQLLTQRAELLSQPQSSYCRSSLEALALTMQSN